MLAAMVADMIEAAIDPVAAMVETALDAITTVI